MFRRHCSDETLLALVDGELSRLGEWRTRQHLKVCWRCRTRMAELEQQVQDFTRAFNKQDFPGPARITEARDRFLERATEYERNTPRAPRFQSRAPGRSWQPAAIAIASLALVLLLVWVVQVPLSSSPARSPIGVEDWIARSGELEARESIVPLHQEFDIEVMQSEPKRERIAGRLSIWSLPDSGKFVSRYVADDGRIRHALFRPDSDRGYVYRAGGAGEFVPLDLSPAADPTLVSVAASGLAIGRLEAGFLRWLEAREWKPVSLSEEISQFSSEDGIDVEVRRLGDSSVELSATRVADGRRVVVRMEVDRQTFRPRVERLRFEASGRVVEFRLSLAESSVWTRERAAGFFVPASLEHEVFGGLIRLPDQAGPIVQAAAPPKSSRPTDVQLLAAEIETRFTLHRARHCVGGSVEVSLRDEGYVDVEAVGLAEDERGRLEAALSAIDGASLVRLRTDAGKNERPPATEKIVVTSPAHLPVEEQLRTGATKGSDAEELITRISNDVVSSSQEAMSEAWALRRLSAMRLHPAWDQLPPHAHWLVEVMVEDHVRVFDLHIGDIGTLLEPLSGEWENATPEAPQPDLGWSELSERAFQSMQQTHQQILSLFAGDGDMGATVRSLGLCLRQLDAGVAELRQRTVRGFGQMRVEP